MEEEEINEEDLDLDLGEETGPAIPVKKGRLPAKSPNNQLVPSPQAEAKLKEMARAKKAEEQREQPAVVAVPRVVPMSTMVNEIYDNQQRQEQLLLAILEALEELRNKK